MSEKFLFLIHENPINTLINNFPSNFNNLKNGLKKNAESGYIIDLVFNYNGILSVYYINDDNDRTWFANNVMQSIKFKNITFTLLNIDASNKSISNYKKIIQLQNIEDYSAIFFNNENESDEYIKRYLFPELEKQFVIYPPVSLKCHIYRNKDKTLLGGILTDITNQIIDKNEINAQPTNGGKRRKTNKKSNKTRKYKKSKKSRKYKKSRK